jgi:hypothetical protein
MTRRSGCVPLPEGPAAGPATRRAGDLTAVIGDNSAAGDHRAALS